MCGRSSLSLSEDQLVSQFPGVTFKPEDIGKQTPLPVYNLCAKTFVPVISSLDPLHFNYFYWGLDMNTFKGELIKGVINARSDKINYVPLFAESIAQRRCLLPATSYFEWKIVKGRKRKLPYLVRIKSQETFSLGGIWLSQEDKEGKLIEKFVLITQEPNAKLSYIHDRMPFIVTKELESDWLDLSLTGREALQMIRQHPDNDIDFYTVTDELNNSYENNPRFIQAQNYEVFEQGSLF